MAAPTLNVTPPFDRIRRGGKSILVNSAGHGVMNDLSTGIVHADASGVLTSSTLVAADMAASFFVDTTSWTPVIAGDSVAGTQTYSAQVGRYSRLGNLVLAQFSIIMTAKGGTTAGSIYIGTLPVTSLNVTGLVQTGAISSYNLIDFTAGYTQLGCYVLANDTKLYLTQGGDNVAAANVAAAAIAATTYIRGAIAYFV